MSSAEQANPQALSRPLVIVCGLLTLLGTVTFFAGIMGEHPETAWRAYHINFLYFGGIAQGAMVLACIFTVVGAKWPGTVKRLAESFTAWVPITFALAIIGFFGREHLFEAWLTEDMGFKAGWLSVGRVFGTDLAIFGILAVLAMIYLYHSLRPSLNGAADNATGVAKNFLTKWTSNWQGDDVEQAHSALIMGRVAPITLWIFAFGFTLIGFDQVMSITPHWYSNLFGTFFSWGCFLSAIAATTVLAALNNNHPQIGPQITTPRLHDLGKMCFAFSVVWMYMFWSQYLVIWYGNMPEETVFFEARLGPVFLLDADAWNLANWNFSIARLMETPWAPICMLVWACCWIIPFFGLLGQKAKKTPCFVGSVAFILLFGLWLERNVLIWPSFSPEERFAWLGFTQIAIALGFLGAFVLIQQVFAKVLPSIVVPKSS
jgi:hypothetical protein